MHKKIENFVFFEIKNPTAFKIILRTLIVPFITSTARIIGPPNTQPLAALNVAFSQQGLNALGITDNLGDPIFSAGQFADAPNLGDDLNDWEAPFKGTNIHGVFLIASDVQNLCDDIWDIMKLALGNSVSAMTILKGAARLGSEAGHEREPFSSFSNFLCFLLQ